MKQWFVGETVRNRQDEAALSVAPLGMEAYVPAIIRTRRRGHHVVEEEQPRFGTYIFVRFDRQLDPWPDLLRGYGPVNSHFKRFLCNADGVPSPVPDKAMAAIMAFKPPAPIVSAGPIIYRPGDLVSWTIAGVSKQGIFVEYCGKRPFIRTWIMGHESICEVRSSDLEPAEAA